MKTLLHTALFAAFFASAAQAQDISGDWQGTLAVGPRQLRLILQIAKSQAGKWNGTLYSIDQGADGIPITSLALHGSDLTFAVDAIRGFYHGTLDANQNSIDGTWTQGPPLPLRFKKATKETAWPRDSSKHTALFIEVEKNVRLEVLDWGGTGRTLVLLAGLGNNAHVFDKFAAKLVPHYHVYGITRRGFEASSTPKPDNHNYSADRLADDVLAVCASLKLDKPVLVGHSIAGEELSSIGSRHPGSVAGLIYLDAGYSYAYYDHSRGDLMIDSAELQKKLRRFQPDQLPDEKKALIEELLHTVLPRFEKNLQAQLKELESKPSKTPKATPPPLSDPMRAIFEGQQMYTEIKSPALTIYAVPHDLSQAFPDSAARAREEAADANRTEAQIAAFQKGVPSAHIVRLPRASHYVFLSNEAEVLREMGAFIGALP